MPVTANFHQKVVRSPPRSPPHWQNGNLNEGRPKYPQYSFTPKGDPFANEAAAANELLDLRSKNINHIIKQRAAVGDYGRSVIELLPPDPRVEQLHMDLEIDKVVLVKMPFEIDTTPGGFYKNQALTQDMSGGGAGKLRDGWIPGARDAVAAAPTRTEAYEYSQNGTAAMAMTPDGRLLRGGWTVS